MLAYQFVVFDGRGRVEARFDFLSQDDDTARKHPPCPAPHGAELRRSGRVVARYGAWDLGHDRPEPGAIRNLERIFRPSAP